MGKSLKQLKCLLVLVIVEFATQLRRCFSSSKSVYLQAPPNHGSVSNAVGSSPTSKQLLIAAKPDAPAPIIATVFDIVLAINVEEESTLSSSHMTDMMNAAERHATNWLKRRVTFLNQTFDDEEEIKKRAVLLNYVNYLPYKK